MQREYSFAIMTPNNSHPAQQTELDSHLFIQSVPGMLFRVVIQSSQLQTKIPCTEEGTVYGIFSFL